MNLCWIKELKILVSEDESCNSLLVLFQLEEELGLEHSTANVENTGQNPLLIEPSHGKWACLMVQFPITMKIPLINRSLTWCSEKGNRHLGVGKHSKCWNYVLGNTCWNEVWSWGLLMLSLLCKIQVVKVIARGICNAERIQYPTPQGSIGVILCINFSKVT